jgi:two-component system sensor histidine kinase UhpB
VQSSSVGQFPSQRAADKTWRDRLYRIPLAYKILIVNSAIVAGGAVLGTIITVRWVLQFPEDVPYLLISFFAVSGILISFLVNSWVLTKTLTPLDRLQDAVDDVRAGKTDVVVNTGPVSDERFDRLADTFNQMLAQLEENAHQMQQLSRLILQAQEVERLRLARELHDEAAQALTSLIVHLRLLERAKNPEEAQKRVVELRELTAQALDDVRRVSLDLRPTILDDLGLAPALEWRVDEFNKLDEVTADLTVRGLSRRLPPDPELVLYRTGQEALSNVAKHAQATTVSVGLWTDDECVYLDIRDNGCGFEPDMPISESGSGLGLLGMRERLGMIGGELTIETAPGRGSTIRARAPLPSQNDDNPSPGTTAAAGQFNVNLATAPKETAK